jgi:cytosine/uracil/thiamine/allantoin permease
MRTCYYYLYYLLQVPMHVGTIDEIRALQKGPGVTIDVFSIWWWALPGSGTAS